MVDKNCYVYSINRCVRRCRWMVIRSWQAAQRRRHCVTCRSPSSRHGPAALDVRTVPPSPSCLTATAAGPRTQPPQPAPLVFRPVIIIIIITIIVFVVRDIGGHVTAAPQGAVAAGCRRWSPERSVQLISPPGYATSGLMFCLRLF